MSMLDALIGPFWSVLDVLKTKRSRIDVGAGLTYTDDPNNDCGRLTAQGNGDALTLRGIAVDALVGLVTGWMLAYDQDTAKFIAVRGMQVLKTGTVAIDGVTPQAISCSAVADGDQVSYTFKSTGGTPKYSCATTLVNVGVGVECAGEAGDTSTFNYCIWRPGAGPVA